MPLTNRRILTFLIASTSVLAVGSLLLGLFAGHRILRWMGLAGFVSMLDQIPVASSVVTSLSSLILFSIGIGLCWKGTTETLMKSMVPGTIKASRFCLSPGDTQDEYLLYSRVTYIIDGVSFEGEGQHHTPEPTQALARRRLEELHAQDPVDVFYKPGDPRVIYLDAPPDRTLTVLLLGAWIILTGLVTVFLSGIGLVG